MFGIQEITQVCIPWDIFDENMQNLKYQVLAINLNNKAFQDSKREAANKIKLDQSHNGYVCTFDIIDGNWDEIFRNNGKANLICRPTTMY